MNSRDPSYNLIINQVDLITSMLIFKLFRHFLYGKPLPRYTTPPEGFNTTGCFIKRLLSPAKPLANISTSDSSEDHGHHVHYSHHEHFQQDAGLPHYKDLLRSLDVGSGKNTA